MMIKDLGPGVVTAWEGLRPVTRKMLVGILESDPSALHLRPKQKFSYDAHADWELGRLLSALDEQAIQAASNNNPRRLHEIKQLAETCAGVLESQTGSAEIFIQLAERALRRNDYEQLDKLSNRLAERFAASEIAEIVRQTTLPQIRAIAYETLAMLPITMIIPLLDDSLYLEIAAGALEQKAYEFDSEEAREIVEQLDLSDVGELD